MKCPKCGSEKLEEVKSSLIFKCKKCGYRSNTRSFLEEKEQGKPKTEREYYYRRGERIKVERS